MICLYGRWVFKGKKSFWDRERNLTFIGEFTGTEREFLDTYHKLYPNEQLQIFGHKYKPLSRDLRWQIENFMTTDPFFIQLNREETLKKLLND